VPSIISSSQAGERMGEIEFQGGAQSIFEQASELREQAGEHMSKMTEQAGKQMGEIDFQGGAQNAPAQASELGEQAGEHMSKMTEQALAAERIGEIGFQGGAQNALAQASELREQAGEHMSKMTEQAGERMGEIGFQGGAQNARTQASKLCDEAMDQMENTSNANLSDVAPYASVEANNVAKYVNAAASEAKQWAEGAGVFQAMSDAREFVVDPEATQQAAVLGGAALEAARNVGMGAVGDTVSAYAEAVSKIGSILLDSAMLESGLQVNTPCAFLL